MQECFSYTRTPTIYNATCNVSRKIFIPIRLLPPHALLDHDITMDLAASIDEGHVQKFTRVMKEFNSITPFGEKNVTVEDVTVLEGFATVGDPVLTTFQS
ncbi:hypothetical protein JHK85_051322 [Glycine max]|nr:hypothetical protein JHK85_051322 [Glycine max]